MSFKRTIITSDNFKDHSLMPIFIVTFALHLVLLGWAYLFNTTVVKPKQEHKRLVVQTITLSPSKSTQVKVKPELIAEGSPPREEIAIKDEEKSQPKSEPEIEPEQAPEEEIEPESNVKQPEPLPPEKPAVTAPKINSQPKKIEKKVEPVETKQKKEVEAKPIQKKIADKKTAVAKLLPPKKPEDKKPAKETPKKEPQKTVKKDVPAKKAITDDKAINELKKNKEQEQQKKMAEKQQREAEEQAAKERQLKLVSQAQERMGKISQTRDKLSSSKSLNSINTKLPHAITSLQIDALPTSDVPQLSDREISYRDEIAGRLKLLLRLPDYGDVKIKLTLERTGKIAKVVVVSSESDANRKYIEKILPDLTFPAFGTRFSNAEQYTFTITLSNEI